MSRRSHHSLGSIVPCARNAHLRESDDFARCTSEQAAQNVCLQTLLASYGRKLGRIKPAVVCSAEEAAYKSTCGPKFVGTFKFRVANHHDLVNTVTSTHTCTA
jgi:hypothetical protein